MRIAISTKCSPPHPFHSDPLDREPWREIQIQMAPINFIGGDSNSNGNWNGGSDQPTLLFCYANFHFHKDRSCHNSPSSFHFIEPTDQTRPCLISISILSIRSYHIASIFHAGLQPINIIALLPLLFLLLSYHQQYQPTQRYKG